MGSTDIAPQRVADYREWTGKYSLVLADPPYNLDLDIDSLWNLVAGDGCLLIFTDYVNLGRMISLCGSRYEGLIVWDKRAGSGLGANGRKLASTCDFIIHCPQSEFRFPSGRPSSFVSLASIPMKRRVHVWEKPSALILWLLLNFTKEGDTVLDPFAGSGTSSVGQLVNRVILQGDIDTSPNPQDALGG